jgi:hypothetical protein
VNDVFRTRLHGLSPARSMQEQSAARLRIRETFDDITTVRARGVTWQQIADLMTADGILATNGEPLTAAKVNALYAIEKAARGGRRRRRTKARPAQPPIRPAEPAGAGAAVAPVLVADEEDDRPRGAFRAIPARTRK